MRQIDSCDLLCQNSLMPEGMFLFMQTSFITRVGCICCALFYFILFIYDFFNISIKWVCAFQSWLYWHPLAVLIMKNNSRAKKSNSMKNLVIFSKMLRSNFIAKKLVWWRLHFVLHFVNWFQSVINISFCKLHFLFCI